MAKLAFSKMLFCMDDVERAQAKAHELEYAANLGESSKTPLILLGEVWVVCAAIVAVVLVAALIAYRLA